MLTWWKNHEIRFSVLAKIAWDILVVYASTIVSESAFSARIRVFDEKISNIALDLVKICFWKKNWDQGKKRQQENEEVDSDGEYDPWIVMNTSFEDDNSTTQQQLWINK